ncbi:hypothetical protein QQ054_25965 [Oscillatoria amoena NRMC-F 0135]|nr:hypothetical protein [Oscillatoria amoena NRMC-F 0135]
MYWYRLLVFHTLNQKHRGTSRSKKVAYEEIDLEEMVKRYFGKNAGLVNSTEGIYSVSAVINNTNRPFLSSHDRTKVIDRKDNYARVAILKAYRTGRFEDHFYDVV